MGHFYFVRHGQTVWNVENKICGCTDSPLTDLGREQAAETAHAILDVGIKADQILYSPLSRARDTALIISEIIGVPAVSEPRLLEQNYGTWEGTARDGEAFFKAKQSLSERLGGGESMLQVAQRVYNLIDDVKADFEATGRVYILVAHNGISRVVESYFRDMTTEEFARFGIRNCECREYTF